eukprot:6187977-Pleurochrysis_carterae.AAC.3
MKVTFARRKAQCVVNANSLKVSSFFGTLAQRALCRKTICSDSPSRDENARPSEHPRAQSLAGRCVEAENPTLRTRPGIARALQDAARTLTEMTRWPAPCPCPESERAAAAAAQGGVGRGVLQACGKEEAKGMKKCGGGVCSERQRASKAKRDGPNQSPRPHGLASTSGSTGGGVSAP